MAFWTCPACSRKVPGYAAACHCGASRTTAHNVPAVPAPSFGPRPFSTRDFTWQIWVALALMMVTIGLGIWQLSRKAEPQRMPPLLGIIDPKPSGPTPRPKATPKPVQTPTPNPGPTPE